MAAPQLEEYSLRHLWRMIVAWMMIMTKATSHEKVIAFPGASPKELASHETWRD